MSAFASSPLDFAASFSARSFLPSFKKCQDKVFNVYENLFSSNNEHAIMVSTIKPLIFKPKLRIQHTSYIAL